MLSCFKSYDLRGRLGDELNEDIAYRVGRAYAQYLSARRVAVGGDVRPSSTVLKQALAEGLMAGGADVIDLGMTGTEEVYFAAFHADVDGGIEVTASHNPLDYNGMKFVRRGARPISGDSGLRSIQALAEANDFIIVARPGRLEQRSFRADYIAHLMGYIDPARFQAPLTLVVNAGNGAAGPVLDALEAALGQAGVPLRLIKIQHEPDGAFPNGIPNPLLPERRQATIEAVRAHGADMGIAWDGDFDRCFLFDDQGGFVEGYYIVGLLAQAFLARHPGEKIIHDPRLVWNTIDVVDKAGGVAVQSKTGHAFIKERMRAENAIYGGEMSAHHYFRDFAYCDSGMIPWLLVAELLSASGRRLSALLQDRIAAFPCSGEINYTVADAARACDRVLEHYRRLHPRVERVDGLSLDCGDWRLNLRASNTEPLLRLNVESRGKPELVAERVAEVEALLKTL